jgi:hypothetical protein
MSTPVSNGPRRPQRPIAALILGTLSALHGATAFVLVAGGRTPATALEGFVIGTTAAVLLVGAILSHGLVQVRGERRNPMLPQ